MASRGAAGAEQQQQRQQQRARAGRWGRARAAVARHLLGVDVQRAEDAQVDRRDRPRRGNRRSRNGNDGACRWRGGAALEQTCRPEACSRPSAPGDATSTRRARGSAHLAIRRRRYPRQRRPASATRAGTRSTWANEDGRQRGVWEPVVANCSALGGWGEGLAAKGHAPGQPHGLSLEAQGARAWQLMGTMVELY